ncbi:MAG: hypothetical protein LBO66_11770 [Deltaproteobacteria bacterium]|jgi:hypothetical protein|nr:hypothetical protein [Deltaproteobacteria bacterium]
MARPVDPNAQFRVKAHFTNGRAYASTQPPTIDPLTGKKKYRYVHWGSLDENLKFTPNAAFYEATPEERARLIFPDNWDMSLAEQFTDLKNSERPDLCSNCVNRLYGDIWLLERVADITGIRQDLLKVFHDDPEMVNEILTLAFFACLTDYNFNRVADWQNIVKAPTQRGLTPPIVTDIAQFIDNRRRAEFIRLRVARLGKDDLYAIESTDGSAAGVSHADIRWGDNPEKYPPEKTMDIVAYSLSSHTPVYYGTFPEFSSSERSLDILLKDLEEAGCKDLFLVTGRGYKAINNINQFISLGQSFVSRVLTTQREVARIIAELDFSNGHPESMKLDYDNGFYYEQYDITREIREAGAGVESSDKLKLNLYFNPFRAVQERMMLEIKISDQKTKLNALIENKSEVDSATIKNDFGYLTIVLNPNKRTVKSFEANTKIISKVEMFAGFFSILTHGLDFDASKIYHAYLLRDKQARYFQRMKDRLYSNSGVFSPDDAMTSRLFILFVSLILGSYVNHIRESSELKNIFPSPLEIFDAMRPIRCIERPNMDTLITPFDATQLHICKEFGVNAPGCLAPTHSRQKSKNKKGAARP